MASSEKSDWREFSRMRSAGVPYIVTPQLAPDTFYYDSIAKVYYIGAGTDLHARLFWIRLTMNDRRFLKALQIDPDT